jgi:adhesin/invasin
VSGRRFPGALRAALCVALVALGCSELEMIPPGPVILVRVTPDTVVLRVGDSAQVQAAALDATAALHSHTPITWSTGSAAVAGVEPTGLVRATGAGTTTVTATTAGIQGTAVVIVTGAPASIAVAGGDGQTAAVNSAVATPPSVLVTDGGGNPVANVAVTFAVAGGGGSVSGGGPVLTGLDGIATVGTWTLGPTPGANTLTATAGEPNVAGSPVTFTATATVGSPNAATSTVTAAPSAIVPSSGQSFATVTVTVRDSAGSTIAGATVTLAVSGTGNIVSQPTAPTDLQGRATGTIASSVAETKTITATVNGTVTVTQTATVVVTASAPASIGIRTQPGGAVSNADLAVQPVVEFRDPFGNPVASANGPITVSLLAGNGTLVTSGSLTVNAVNGVATFSGLRIRGLRAGGDTIGTGPHVLRFSAPGFGAVDSDTFQVAVSFAYNVLDVWTRGGCASGCHSFGTYAGNFGNAAFGACAGSPRIVPGDPAASVTYEKIRTATPACGGVMPTSGLLSPIQIQLIRDWILQGAQNN